MSIYIRVKRKKMTIFLETSTDEKISFVKRKLEPLVKVPADSIRLLTGDKQLEEDKSLSHYNIDNDDVVGMVLKDQETGAWENLEIIPVSLSATSAVDASASGAGGAPTTAPPSAGAKPGEVKAE
eukprot:Nk52_evm1s2631 gene=Nk52_evmTU1s2631